MSALDGCIAGMAFSALVSGGVLVYLVGKFYGWWK